MTRRRTKTGKLSRRRSNNINGTAVGRRDTSLPAAALGQAKNTNQGLRAATGDLIRILHSDDILHPECLAWEQASFVEHAPLSLLFQDCIPFQRDEEISWNTSPLIRFVEPYQYFEEFLSVSTALPSGTIFRMHCWKLSVG